MVIPNICDSTIYHEFAFYIVTFEPTNIQTGELPENDHLNLILLQDINVVCKQNY